MKKFFTVLLLMLLMGSIVNGAYSVTDYAWKPFDGHWYAPTFIQSTWTNALEEALAVTGADGHLVTIDSPEENAWLTANFDGIEPTGAASLGAWIGYYDVQGSWVWESGESVTYHNEATFWGNVVPGIHAYLHTASHNPEPGSWNMNATHDIYPSAYLHGIIETTVIPAPSAIMLGGIGVVLVVGWLRRRVAL